MWLQIGAVGWRGPHWTVRIALTFLLSPPPAGRFGREPKFKNLFTFPLSLSLSLSLSLPCSCSCSCSSLFCSLFFFLSALAQRRRKREKDDRHTELGGESALPLPLSLSLNPPFFVSYHQLSLPPFSLDQTEFAAGFPPFRPHKPMAMDTSGSSGSSLVQCITSLMHCLPLL